jgi:hypothetical protein
VRSWVKVGCDFIAYRGDSRHPDEFTENVKGTKKPKFTKFAPREASGPLYRIYQQDVDPDTAVCATMRPEIALLFPIPPLPEAKDQRGHYPSFSDQTYLYAFMATQYFDTHYFQHSASRLPTADDIRPTIDVTFKHNASALEPAKELAFLEVPWERVIGAWKVERTWKGRDKDGRARYEDGCAFTFRRVYAKEGDRWIRSLGEIERSLASLRGSSGNLLPEP